jgi:secreted trypsin-like serine protease
MSGMGMNRHSIIVIVTLALMTNVSMIRNTLAQEEIKLGGRRIVGGEPTDIQKHPWQLALNIRRPNGTYLCGGSYIAEKWVVSAAHCFRRSDPVDAINAKAGATNYVDKGVWSQVDKFIIHEHYDRETYAHDIALMKLKAVPAARVLPLVDSSLTIPVGQPLEVTGWGSTTEGGQVSKVLLRANVPYVDSATCNGPDSYGGRVLSGMMCAGHRGGGTDSCQGDSGGPLVWRTEAGPVLVGVVSFGDGCARQLKFGVYTRVSLYRAWINQILADDRK